MRTHDGFFFRFALGVGHFSDSVLIEEQGDIEFTASGLAVATELSFGGSPAPGIVLGGGIYNHIVSSARADELDVGGTSRDADIEWESSSVALYAPFVDIYPNANQGFHIQAALGYALLAAGEGFSDTDTFTQEAASFGGIGLLVGIGVERFFAEQWSVGVIGRVMYASVSDEADALASSETVEHNHSILAPSLLIGVTYH